MIFSASFPLFVLALGGPLNLIGIIVASSRAKEKPAKWKLNRLGIILNASPYVIFFVIMFVGLAVAPFFCKPLARTPSDGVCLSSPAGSRLNLPGALLAMAEVSPFVTMARLLSPNCPSAARSSLLVVRCAGRNLPLASILERLFGTGMCGFFTVSFAACWCNRGGI